MQTAVFAFFCFTVRCFLLVCVLNIVKGKVYTPHFRRKDVQVLLVRYR